MSLFEVVIHHHNKTHPPTIWISLQNDILPLMKASLRQLDPCDMMLQMVSGDVVRLLLINCYIVRLWGGRLHSSEAGSISGLSRQRR